MEEEPLYEGLLVGLVEDDKRSRIFRFGRVLEVCNVAGNDLAIRDEEPGAVNHVRYHHNLIHRCVREFEWCFAGFDVICHDDRICALQSLLQALEGDMPVLRLHSVPLSNADVWGISYVPMTGESLTFVDRHAHMVGDVILSNIYNKVARLRDAIRSCRIISFII